MIQKMLMSSGGGGGNRLFTETQTVVNNVDNTFNIGFVPNQVTLIYSDSGSSTHACVQEFTNITDSQADMVASLYTNGSYIEFNTGTTYSGVRMSGTSLVVTSTVGMQFGGKSLQVIAS